MVNLRFLQASTGENLPTRSVMIYLLGLRCWLADCNGLGRHMLGCRRFCRVLAEPPQIETRS